MNMYVMHAAYILFGLYNYPFSAQWDVALVKILDAGKLLMFDEYVADFEYDNRTVTVWVGNKWCAYGKLHRVDGESIHHSTQYRPKLKTMHRLDFLLQSAKGSSLDKTREKENKEILKGLM